MAYIFVTCLNHAAECQVHRIRGLFFKSVLRQDIGWYDTHQTGDFAVKMAEDLNKIQEGIGEKIGMFIFFMTICICSISNAFYHGWELVSSLLCTLNTVYARYTSIPRLVRSPKSANSISASLGLLVRVPVPFTTYILPRLVRIPFFWNALLALTEELLYVSPSS